MFHTVIFGFKIHKFIHILLKKIMAHELVDSDEEIFGSDESDEEDYTPSDTVSESEEVYDSDQSDFDLTYQSVHKIR